MPEPADGRQPIQPVRAAGRYFLGAEVSSLSDSS